MNKKKTNLKNRVVGISMMAVLAMTVIGCSILAIKKTPKILKDYEISTLKNGLNVLYVADDKLPYISLSLFLLNGSASDSKNETGVTAAALDLLDKGTKEKTAGQIASEIEQLGASFSTNVSVDFSTINLDGLSWQEDQLLSILSELLFTPKFDEKEVERYKAQTVASIQQQLDQLSNLASEILDSYYYGSHPYGVRGEGRIADVKNLNRTKIVNHFNKIFNPNKAWLVVVGKYSSEMKQKIESKFVNWKLQPVHSIRFPLIPQIKGKQILLVNKSDAAQAEIRIGHRGILRTVPDYLPTMVANSVLGQGFTSRLVDRIRDQLGLTYNISSDMDMNINASKFGIRTFTQNGKVGQTLTETLKVYSNFHQNGISEKELTTAKNYMIGKFPQLIETAEKFAYNLMVLRLFGVSDDYLRNYQANVAAIDLDAVNKSIQKNYDPNNLKIVIVAQKDKVLEQLKDLGTVEVVESKDYLK